MLVQKILLRIAKFLGKAILGLLLLFLLVIVLIHLPPIQKQITSKVSNFLSSKIEARVEINKINFSILGNVVIEDLAIWDPSDYKIFSVQKIEVSSSIFDLLAGNLIFDEVSISGADFHLIQGEQELNIQYILNAFQPATKDTTTSHAITLQFKKVLLENIQFEFTSIVNGTTVAVDLGKFATQDAEFSTLPTKIKADQVVLERTTINTLITTPAETNTTTTTDITNKNNFLSPDFGMGIVFEIKDLQLKDNDVYIHKDQVKDTRKFDPSHLTLKNIQISLADILIREDTLAGNLQKLSARLPGFTLSNASTVLQMNRHQLSLSDLHIVSGVNEFKLDLNAPYDLTSANDTAHDRIKIIAQSRINPNDLAYFFSDSLLNQYGPWGLVEFGLEANYALGKGEIKNLNLKTVNSQLQATAKATEVLDLKKVSWNNLVVSATIGPEFKTVLIPFLKGINIPKDIALIVRSSGNTKKIAIDGKIVTTWGDVSIKGVIANLGSSLDINTDLTGEKVDLGKWLNLSMLGTVNLSASTKGLIGDHQLIEINGLISDIELLDQSIHQIGFQSTTRKDSASVAITIEDSNYRSAVSSEISFAGPFMFTNTIQLDSFNLGRLLHRDSTLFISGATKSKIIIDSSWLEGYVAGKNIVFQKQSSEYSLDTMVMHALISPTKSDFSYVADYEKASLESNFDIREPDLFQIWSKYFTDTPDKSIQPTKDRKIHFNLDLVNANLITLLGIDVDDFSSLRVTGELDEQKQTAALQASTGKFKGYGISLDTLYSNLRVLGDSVSASINAKKLFYNTLQLGNMDFNILMKGDRAVSNLLVATDSITLLGLRTQLLTTDSALFVYPEKLQLLDFDYVIEPGSSVSFEKKNLEFNNLMVSHDETQIKLDGDLSAFEGSLTDLDLSKLNFLVSPDTLLIYKGDLSSYISYSRNQQLNLKASIDSLILYNSTPLFVSATAASEDDQVPFEFNVTNSSNRIDLTGRYFTGSAEVDASMKLDINNLELFAFLFSGVMDEMKGAIKGQAAISGPIQKPEFNGYLQFMDVGLTTSNPKLSFDVKDDRIELGNSGLHFNKFTLYDKEHRPLTISGSITSKDYQSFDYALQLNSEQYTLINNPDSTRGKVRGLLVLDSDIKLKGTNKDTEITAKLRIKNETDLTFVTSSNDIELLKSDGIIDFIDPAALRDSTSFEPSVSLYDSLIASLPDFNLNSTVTIEDDAEFRLIINEQSGDYIEASGGANLELGYDRTGNVRLSGNYTIKKGLYRLSFYDLAKKNFNLVQGSAINWRGSPQNGDVSIKAVHTVKSNSIGLVGNEIGENEKSIYKRSLDYEVGININGTIEKPIISFSLDLPTNEKVNFPILANKLERLRQPENESELNKQVFGLLVLGGFLPETTDSELNSNLIATTALTNSVNSLLAGQLNRFADQYIKGVKIDVGIQSFSDFTTPGGQTQTSMDFRVSKSVLDDRLSFEIGGDFDLNQDQSGANNGNNYRGDIAIVYDLTGNGDKMLKVFNNETFDIVYQEIRNTGISIIFIREFESKKKKEKNQ